MKIPQNESWKRRTKTRCAYGHAWEEENIYITPAGYKECKKCTAGRVKKFYVDHPELEEVRKDYYKERHSLPEVKKRQNAYSKRWLENNKEKKATHILVRKAIKAGELKRMPCEKCGADKVHAHHPDYSKPLEVMWLCPKHHRRLHLELLEPN